VEREDKLQLDWTAREIPDEPVGDDGPVLLLKRRRRSIVHPYFFLVSAFRCLIVAKPSIVWILEERPKETTDALVKFL
jgi:hypothetical protein